MTRRHLSHVAAILTVCAAILGLVACESSDETESTTQAAVSMGAMTVCNGCGEFKGSATCCDDDATVCACGMHKGSPGCCRIEKGSTETYIVCVACGQFKGTEVCCVEEAEICSCGMVKGSPGCCKMPK